MYISSATVNVLLFACSTLAAALPSRHSLYSSNGTPVDSPPNIAHASLEGLTHNKIDHSGKAGDPPEKYFHESTFDPHYDGRFASGTLLSSDRLIHLRALIRAYLSTMHTLNAETWIMHGSVLGWWWNQRIMPWDSDIDVQVSESAIDYLAAHHNMTVHTFTDAAVLGEDIAALASPQGKRYLLEINPYYANGRTDDRLDVIDDRWVDIDTGLFIDITTVRVDRRTRRTPSSHSARRSSHSTENLYCKNNHRYLASQIFPLRPSTFEGVPVKIPYAYQELLVEEYGRSSLVDTVFRPAYHVFDRAALEWLPRTQAQMVGEGLMRDSYENVDADQTEDEPLRKRGEDVEVRSGGKPAQKSSEGELQDKYETRDVEPEPEAYRCRRDKNCHWELD